MYENLRKIRTDKRVPTEKMAELLGLKTKAAYYKKETGSIKFSIEEAKKVADYLGMTVDEVFFASELSEMEN